VSDLTTYLEHVDGLNPTPNDYTYRSYEGLILAEGTSWTDIRVEKSGPNKLCFENSYYAARENGWQYVEGFAMSLIPMGHAWCLDGDQVVETTWDTPGSEYYGIAFPLDFVLQTALNTNYWGLFANDYLTNFALLKEGMTTIKGGMSG
jgi:hypothetical protein